MYTGPIDEGAIGAVEIFNGENALGVVPMQYCVLARAPDAIRRFLILQVDVDGFIVGPAHEVEVGINRELEIDFLAADDDQFGRRTSRDRRPRGWGSRGRR